MVIVKIISGPRAGQQNLVSMRPDELAVCAQNGWRWKVDWSTVPVEDLFEWTRQDLVNKVASALIRGGFVRFVTPEGIQEWQAPITQDKMGEIDDTISDSGYNVFVQSDREDGVVIAVHSRESALQ